MLNSIYVSLPRYLCTKEAARFLSLSARTLEKHRTYGTGPLYRKIGGRVVYAVADLLAWADSGIKTSTSDPRTGPSPARRCEPVSECKQNVGTSRA
ncbi:helix-turn-helix domain-containing protein [Bradyrhizobium sp. LB11.1]|uniref:helix-turn-helix transcriptional regulator n=1 Tax=Bradyrhizobium sp. LB11.1 TaxID=3156326 RepID=UPI003393680A